MVTSLDFVHRLKSQNYLVNKWYHEKVLLKTFHLYGNTIGFHQKIKKLEL